MPKPNGPFLDLYSGTAYQSLSFACTVEGEVFRVCIKMFEKTADAKYNSAPSEPPPSYEKANATPSSKPPTFRVPPPLLLPSLQSLRGRRVILASASPRRKQLLTQVHLQPPLVPFHIS